MFRFAPFALATTLACAQSAADLFNKPPASVDQALRARIAEFYDLHTKGDFRKAESLVAEDTKDFFYNHDKPRYLGFEISRITYSDNFTRAKATVLCEQRVVLPGFADKPVKIPAPSYWKVENGQWYWYVDQTELNRTPFGTMKGGPASGPVNLPAAIPTDISQVDWLFKQVKADRQAVTLEPGSSGQITIANGAPGRIKLAIEGHLAGIQAKLDHSELERDQKAVLTLEASSGAASGTLAVRVEPIAQVIQIAVTVR
jgi:hypothetical protein